MSGEKCSDRFARTITVPLDYALQMKFELTDSRNTWYSDSSYGFTDGVFS